MRLTAPAWIALAFTGCVRFGYAPDLSDQDRRVDSGTMRADGAMPDPDADGGKSFIGGTDAAVRGDAAVDAGKLPISGSGGGSGTGVQDAGKLDAGKLDAGALDAGAGDSGLTDAGMLDAGAADSGATDSGTDSGSTDPGTTDPLDPQWTEDCPGDPGILFCDDFEDGLNKWDYVVHSRGTTAVSTDQAHSASYSLRASTSASTSNTQSKARQAVRAFGHRKAGDLWARYFYYLPSSVSVTDKFSIGVISEYEDPWHGFSVLVTPTGIGLERGGTQRTINTLFPRNQWTCIEMHVKVDPSQGQYDFYMNGGHVISILEGNSVPTMGYTVFEVGVHYANFAQGAITAYADDVVLSTRRIGCN